MTLSLSSMISLLKKSPTLNFIQWLSHPPPPKLSLMPGCKSACLNSSGPPQDGGAGEQQADPAISENPEQLRFCHRLQNPSQSLTINTQAERLSGNSYQGKEITIGKKDSSVMHLELPPVPHLCSSTLLFFLPLSSFISASWIPFILQGSAQRSSSLRTFTSYSNRPAPLSYQSIL